MYSVQENCSVITALVSDKYATGILLNGRSILRPLQQSWWESLSSRETSTKMFSATGNAGGLLLLKSFSSSRVLKRHLNSL